MNPPVPPERLLISCLLYTSFNEDGTPKTRTGEAGTVYYYRNVRTQAAMVTLDYDGNVLAIAGGLGEKTKRCV